MSADSKMWLGIGGVVALAVILFIAFSAKGAGPPACEVPYQTPCVLHDGRILVPDRTGQLVAMPRAAWNAESGDAQYDLVPPFSGPGPVGP